MNIKQIIKEEVNKVLINNTVPYKKRGVNKKFEADLLNYLKSLKKELTPEEREWAAEAGAKLSRIQDEHVEYNYKKYPLEDVMN